MKKRVFCTLLAGLMLLSVCFTMSACRGESVFTVTYLDVFDTVLTISIPAPNHATAEMHATAIHECLSDIHRDLDIYHHYDGRANLFDLNAAAGGEPLAVSPTIMDVLLLGKAYGERTGGRLNICMGALLRQWHDARQAGDRLPDSDAIAEALSEAISPEALVLDPLRGTAQITDPRVSVDVGAVAKGYAMSRVQAYAEEAGLASLLVNLGGHVLALGTRPDGQAWTVRVRDPLQATDASVYREVKATAMSVVTSGDYERTFTVDGRAYHHIMDPSTGYPADRYHAVTVTVPTTHTAEADALSTALFLMDIEAGFRLLDTIPGVTAVWTSVDGTVTAYPSTA